MKNYIIITLLLGISLNLYSIDYIITEHGVIADSTVLNTKAIQGVIDKAYANKGGTIVIPKGVFLSGALFFKPNTHLKIMEGAVLKGSDNITDYPLQPSRMEGKKLDYFPALINAYQVDHFTITGPGTINGNGLKYWKSFWAHRDSMKQLGKESTNLEVHRPRLLFIWGCNHVTIKNVKLHNSGFWTTHLYQCTNVLIENCDIRSPFKPVPAPSTDGVDIDVCKGVTIRGCYISVNDDAVCVKGGKGPLAHTLPENGKVEDVLVENCTFGPAHATLTMGSECIHARNIVMRNCTVQNTCPILKFKMRPDTYQIYEHITIDGITGTCGSLISMAPWKQFYSLEGTNEKPFGQVRHITMANINVKCNSIGELAGNPNDTVTDVFFRDISVEALRDQFKNAYGSVEFFNVLVNDKPFMSK